MDFLCQRDAAIAQESLWLLKHNPTELIEEKFREVPRKVRLV